MRMVMLAIVAFGTACASGSGWDPLAQAPQQPELPVAVDPNSAYEVYAYGESLLERAPAKAADVFHRASRLDPGWADPLYARRIALLSAEPDRFWAYLSGGPNVARQPGMQRLDSLYRHALMLNPYLRPRYDARAYTRILSWVAEREMRREHPAEVVDPGEIEYWMGRYIQGAGPGTRAWIAYGEGRYAAALELYRDALKISKEKAYVHADISRTLFMLGQYAEAREEMERAVEAMRDQDQTKLVRLYESKALFEHSIGLMLEQIGDAAGAKEAYARALQEDLGYHPAHLRLGDLALAAGDTATALAEMALAVEIREGDPVPRWRHGQVLAAAGRLDEAEREFLRAIELEPLIAAPYLELARVIDARGRSDEAVKYYRDYLAHADRKASAVDQVKRRLAELGADPSGAGGGVR